MGVTERSKEDERIGMAWLFAELKISVVELFNDFLSFCQDSMKS